MSRMTNFHLPANDTVSCLASTALSIRSLVISPFYAVCKIVRQYNLPSGLQAILGSQEWMRYRFQGDSHLEWILQR
jgi:hypothetical protein